MMVDESGPWAGGPGAGWMSQGHGVVAQDSWKLKGVAQDWGQAWCVDSGQVAWQGRVREDVSG